MFEKEWSIFTPQTLIFSSIMCLLFWGMQVLFFSNIRGSIGLGIIITLACVVIPLLVRLYVKYIDKKEGRDFYKKCVFLYCIFAAITLTIFAIVTFATRS